MANQWAAHALSGRELRLDPCHLPQKIVIKSHKGKALICSLTEKGVSFSRQDARKEIAKMVRLVPRQQFFGVAAKIVEAGGQKAVTLELAHRQPELTVPLLVSRNLSDLIIDWRLWADVYNLPMLMVGEDGAMMRVHERSSITKYFASENLQVGSKFMLRCRGFSLGTRLMVANKVMFG